MTQNISQGERIHSIDIIRGIAVLGIFLVNWPVIAGIDSRDITGVYEGLDSYIRLFYDMFIQTKFYTIFSFLFGLGFYIFMTRAEAKTDRPKTLFVRRLLILLLFGFLHYVLLWDGDILHTYAITGFFLFLFYKRKPRTILIWSIVLLSFMQLFTLLGSLVMLIVPVEELGLSTAIMPLENWGLQITDRFYSFYSEAISNSLIMLPETLGLFLLGLYAGKRYFPPCERIRSKTKEMANYYVCFNITDVVYYGLLLYEQSTIHTIFTYGYYDDKRKDIIHILHFHAHAFITKEKWQKILRPFQYVGRMALTNYISHTIVTLLVFGILFKNDYLAPLWVGPLFCIGFYTLQIFISRWWLSRYQYGPLEYIWRLGTYGKMMPLKEKQGLIVRPCFLFSYRTLYRNWFILYFHFTLRHHIKYDI